MMCATLLAVPTWAASPAEKTAAPAPGAKSTPGLEAARTISLVTGVAISPLLGVGAVGAYEYWKAPAARRPRLPWFAQPWFWVPALLLVIVVAAKDIIGAAAPNIFKKPFDVAETLENKISGLVAAGAFVPLVVSIFPEAAGLDSEASLGALGFAAIDVAAVGNIMLVPFAIVIFALVWLASHTINILILLSPFTIVDTTLKGVRVLLLSLVTATSFANPYFGAACCVVLIIISWFLAGWSFRLSVLGTVFIWDFFTLRRLRFQPGAESNWMFTARKLQDAPIRTCGRLRHSADGSLTFEYRPWLILKRRGFALPAGAYAVGRGLFYPEIGRVEADKMNAMFILSPRYQTHEEALARAYGLKDVRDTGILRGVNAVWAWLRQSFGAPFANFS
jgi:hypothetical protein